MNVEVGQSCPQSWLEVFFQTNMANPKSQSPSQMLSYMNASGEQICFMSMAACLSLIPPISSTWSRIKVPFQKKVKFQLLILDNDALTSLLHCHYLAFLFVLFWGGQSSNTSVCSCCHVDTLPLIEWSSEACKPPFPPSQTPSCRKKHPTSNSKPAKPIDLSLLILTLHQFHHSLTNPTTSWYL